MEQLGWKNSICAALAAIGMLGAVSVCRGQQTPPSPAPQAPPALQEPATKDDNRTPKQKLLADQAQRLVAMATELKVEVDKTNKNILSLDVVRKAEEIEALAHRMKDQGRK